LQAHAHETGQSGRVPFHRTSRARCSRWNRRVLQHYNRSPLRSFSQQQQQQRNIFSCRRRMNSRLGMYKIYLHSSTIRVYIVCVYTPSGANGPSRYVIDGNCVVADGGRETLLRVNKHAVYCSYYFDFVLNVWNRI